MAHGKKKEKILMPEEKLQEALVPKSEQPYEVPENWRYYRINGLVTHLKRGKAPKYVEQSNILVFAQKCNQKDGTIAMEKAQFLSPEITVRIREDEFLKDEDVLINSTGTGTLGRVGYYRSHYALPYLRVLPDSHMTVIRALSIVSPKYLYYYLKLKQEYLELQGVGTTNQKELRPEAIGNIIMPLPPLPEQQRIVSRIESLFAKLDEAKEKAQAVIDEFEDRKAAILHKAFTGELTEGWRKTKNIDFDNSWRNCTLGDFASSQYGYTEKASFEKIGPRFLRITDIQDGQVIWTDVPYCKIDDKSKSKYSLSFGDIVVARIGATTGKSYMIIDEVDAVYASYLIRVSIQRKELLRSKYLYYFLQCPSYWRQITELSSGIAQPGVNGNKLKTLQLPIPEVKEQDIIVDYLDRLLPVERQAKESAEQVIAQIDTMKKSILSRAFRGELGTNDPSDESAEELLKRIL